MKRIEKVGIIVGYDDGTSFQTWVDEVTLPERADHLATDKIIDGTTHVLETQDDYEEDDA